MWQCIVIKSKQSACFRKPFRLHRVKFRLDKLLITKVPPVTYLLLLWVTGVRAFTAWQVSDSTCNKSCPVKPETFANIQGKLLKCETPSYSSCFVVSFLLAVLTLQIWISLICGLAHIVPIITAFWVRIRLISDKIWDKMPNFESAEI